MPGDEPAGALRRVGIVDSTQEGWSAGSSFTRMLLASLGAACRAADVELYVFSDAPEALGAAAREIVAVRPRRAPTWPALFPGEAALRQWLHRGEKTRPFRGEMRLRRLVGSAERAAALQDPLFAAAREHDVPVLLPLRKLPPAGVTAETRTIGWIPDFQHVHLPQFFSEYDRAERDAVFRHLTERATRVLLSSRSARDHFAAFAPEHVGKAEVAPFPSLLAFTGISEDGADVANTLRRFHLPAKFALVCNQFWAHKNHAVVVEAVARLQQRGLRLPVVFTGVPADYRDPGNRHLSRLLQQIAAGGVWDRITILGQVDEGDLLRLMRAAAVIVQPSRFEGWSTVVQDAKALGRPLLCSDLPVHREQAPGALGFFGCDAPDDLADLLAEHWSTLPPGPDADAEQSALLWEREFADRHGRTLLDICRRAAARGEDA